MLLCKFVKVFGCMVMNIIKQLNVCCNVSRKGEKVYSQCIFLDNEWETVIEILADIHSFIIAEANWEVHKAPKNIPTGFFNIQELEGKSGYIEGKAQLNTLLLRSGGEMLKYMVNQCINGIIQAETYVFKQRGFFKEEEYDIFWDKLEKNGCRMYSHKSEEDLPWSKYAAPLTRKNNLFNRFKSCKTIYYGGKYMFAYGSFSDSFHKIDINIEFNANTGFISDCEIVFSKAPGKACFDNKAHRKKLIGRNIKEIRKKDIISLFGKSEGCYHLVEIMSDILRLV